MSRKWLKTPKELGPKLYQKHNGKYFYSFTIHGKSNQRKGLRSSTVKLALREAFLKQEMHYAAGNGLTDVAGRLISDPFAEQGEDAAVTVFVLYSKWVDAGYPDFKKLHLLSDERQCQYVTAIKKAYEFFKDYEAEKLKPSDLIDFYEWRTADCKPGGNQRATDTALDKLSSLLNWSVEKGYIDRNPIKNRRKFQCSNDVEHCPDFMCRSDEELHKLCGWFLNKERIKYCSAPAHRTRQAIGWQLLFAAYFGGRKGEVLNMRLDAKDRESGYINWPLRWIYMSREKGGANPYVLLDQIEGNTAQEDLISAHRNWHRETYNGATQWMFPNRDATGPCRNSNISGNLKLACEELGLPKRTSHGMRAYYVGTLRSQGLDDTEIAIRLGHRSGVGLVEKTYGEAVPGWRGAKEQDWLTDNPRDLAYAKWSRSLSQSLFLCPSG